MKLPRIALAGGCLAIVLLLAAGPGSRAGIWHFSTGFRLIQWGAYIGIATVVLVFLSAFITRPLRPSAPALVVALILGGTTCLLPWTWLRNARSVPAIHDVTTDLEDPPSFVAVLPLRAGAPNAAAYGGPAVAAAQRRGYPDLHPLELSVDRSVAFARAVTAARSMGWKIVDVDSLAGRIEATATTTWFGFKDDVVVRVRPTGAGSRIDVRSVSRVGGSDVGTNAKRVRAYLNKLGA